jgi:hypothetical protein
MRRPLKFLLVLGAGLFAACAPIGAQTAKINEGGAKPAIQPLRSAVSRAMVGQSFVSGLASTYVQGQSRMRMSLGAAPLSELRVCYGNWAGPHEAAGSGNITVEAAVESDGLLGVARFTWSGADTVTLMPGQTACSDAVYPAAFGLAAFPPNTAEWFRTGVVAASSSGFPFSYLLSAPGEGMYAGPAFTSQVNATGPMTAPSGGAAAPGMLTPFAVLGRYTVAMPTLCDIGDSISAGIDDTAIAEAQGQLAGHGYVGRAAYNSASAGIYPVFRLGIAGDRADDGGYVQRAGFFRYCTHGVAGWGVNDIQSESASMALSNLKTAWTLMHANGIQYIYQTTLTPRTTSTDGWATDANQTAYDSNFAPGGPRDQLNALIRAAVGANFLTDYIDVAAQVQASDNIDIWLTNGTHGYCTSDGLHPLGTCHALMAPLLAAALQSAGPQLPAPYSHDDRAEQKARKFGQAAPDDR